MKPLIKGCPKCGLGPLSQIELYKDEESGELELEYECVTCGYTLYRKVKPTDVIKSKSYRS